MSARSLFGGGVDQIGGRRAGLAHPHVQRAVLLKEKPRSAWSICIEDTPRSSTTPSSGSPLACPGRRRCPPPAAAGRRKAGSPGGGQSQAPGGRGRRRSPGRPRPPAARAHSRPPKGAVKPEAPDGGDSGQQAGSSRTGIWGVRPDCGIGLAADPGIGACSPQRRWLPPTRSADRCRPRHLGRSAS